MKCPFCGAFLENSLHKALGGVQTDPVISITNVDYVLEVGNRIKAIIEEKRTYHHIAKTTQLITLKKIAKSLNVPLLVVFVDDALEEVTVYDLPTSWKLPRTQLFNFERLDPVFVGDFSEFRDFILYNFVYYALPTSNGRRKGWRW